MRSYTWEYDVKGQIQGRTRKEMSSYFFDDNDNWIESKKLIGKMANRYDKIG